MKLTPGQQAIDFEMKDLQGDPIALRDFQAKKLLLSFYRYAS